MKVLHLTSHLNVGGVTSYTLTLAAALARRGHHVRIASGGGSLEGRAESLGVTVWRVPLHTSVEFSPQVLLATRQLDARLRAEPVDLLHAHTRVGQVVADRLARRLRLPYVTTWHGFFRPNLGRTLWPCTGLRTIAISEPVRQHLLATFRVPPERVRLIPHGIDPTPFESSPDPSARQRLRERLGLPSDAPVVGTVARLVASKGVEVLIRSLPAIRASVPDARLLIVGDGEARGSLERLAAGLGLDRAVSFAGALPDIAAALSLMHVYVFLPADREGFGLSLLEAMASGRPIVAVRRGQGATWVLEESGVGTLVEEADPVALARGITRLLQDGEAACRMAGQARAIVRERYALDRMVDQVEAVYREAIGHATSVAK